MNVTMTATHRAQLLSSIAISIGTTARIVHFTFAFAFPAGAFVIGPNSLSNRPCRRSTS